MNYHEYLRQIPAMFSTLGEAAAGPDSAPRPADAARPAAAAGELAELDRSLPVPWEWPSSRGGEEAALIERRAPSASRVGLGRSDLS